MHRILTKAARAMAIAGGAVLTALVVLTCASVAGRVLNTMLHGWIGDLAPGLAERALSIGIGPINGDFEIVEAGVAFAIFAFLPICQLERGHAVVDVFTSRMPAPVQKGLQILADGAFAAVLVLIAVQLFSGTVAKYAHAENTFILQFPVWWGYAASLFAACIAAVVSVHVATRSLASALFGGASPE